MLRRPKHSKIEVVARKEEEEDHTELIAPGDLVPGICADP
jgi:hypothetical protein